MQRQLTRVLFVAADPDRELNVNEEFARMSRALVRVPGIELRPVFLASIDQIQDELIARDFDVFHLVAHGRKDIVTLLGPDGAAAQDEPVAAIVELLRGHESLRCVVLNVCNSASWLSEPFGPALVAMRGPVGDDAALEFSDAFYRSIAAGRSVEVAFDQGKARAERKAPLADFRPQYWPECFGVIGIRSYPRFAERAENRCQFFCDLGSRLPEGDTDSWDWRGAVGQLGAFIERDDLAARLGRQECRVHLDCPLSISLHAGRLFGAHANVHPMQGYPVRTPWRPNVRQPSPTRSPWRLTRQDLAGARKLVVSISMSGDVRPLVSAHIGASAEPYTWVDFAPLGGSGTTAVHDADHALALARTLASELPRLRAEGSHQTIDLFFAAPGAFMFLLGQQGAVLGALNLHHKVHRQERYGSSFCSNK